MNEIAAGPQSQVVARTAGRRVVVPAIVASAGDHASRRFLKFFAATRCSRNI
jgi:hypothetical protein